MSYASVVEGATGACSIYIVDDASVSVPDAGSSTGAPLLSYNNATPVSMDGWQVSYDGLRQEILYEFGSPDMPVDSLISVRFDYDYLTDVGLMIRQVSGDSTILLYDEASAIDDTLNHIVCISFVAQPTDTYLAELIATAPGTSAVIWQSGNTCGTTWP
jgi:hypothetical protein